MKTINFKAINKHTIKVSMEVEFMLKEIWDVSLNNMKDILIISFGKVVLSWWKNSKKVFFDELNSEIQLYFLLKDKSIDERLANDLARQDIVNYLWEYFNFYVNINE